VLLRMSRASALGALVQRTSWGRRAVQRFVAGNTIDEAVAAAVEMKGRGFTVTLDRLGEASTGEKADAYAADAARLLEAQAAAGLEPNVSVKLTAIGLSEGSAVATARLESILMTAQRVNGFVRVDAEHAESLDRVGGLVLEHLQERLPDGFLYTVRLKICAS
jgi:proline dehydrogenase